MYNFTIPMALMDFIPVAFFGISAVILMKDLYARMSKAIYAVFAAGSINVFLAGFLKATWKLLYAANICDFSALEEMFLPVNSMGLLLAGFSLVGMLCRKRKGVTVLSAAPAVFGGSFVFIMMMVLGLGGMCAALSSLAARMKKRAQLYFSCSALFLPWAWALCPARILLWPGSTGQNRASTPHPRAASCGAFLCCTKQDLPDMTSDELQKGIPSHACSCITCLHVLRCG